MRFGALLYGCDPDGLVEQAVRAEELGYDSVWRGDHLLVPRTTDSSHPEGVPALPQDVPILDVLTLLAYIAQATTTIRLATGILVLPLREPVALARAVQTLDIVSHGRLTLGIGVGWLREEFELLGREFRPRDALTDELVAVLKTLFADPIPSFSGAHFSVDGYLFEPKPVQRPHPPIIGGGESDRALRRAATLCNGWYGHWPAPEQAAATVKRLRRLRNESGLDGPFEITIRVPPELSADDVKRFEEAAVDRLVVINGAFEDAYAPRALEVLETFSERVMHRP